MSYKPGAPFAARRLWLTSPALLPLQAYDKFAGHWAAELKLKDQEDNKPSLVRALRKTFGGYYMLGAIFKCLWSTFVITGAFFFVRRWGCRRSPAQRVPAGDILGRIRGFVGRDRRCTYAAYSRLRIMYLYVGVGVGLGGRWRALGVGREGRFAGAEKRVRVDALRVDLSLASTDGTLAVH